MRNISFFLTQRQVREQSKTVTRRLGWDWVNVGTLLQPIVKGQGLKKGETVERIGGPIRVVSVTREPLGRILGRAGDVAAEGFPEMTGIQFANMFCAHNNCDPDDEVTRIEFEYTEPRA